MADTPPPSDPRRPLSTSPYPDPLHEESINEVILIVGGLRVTFRLARLFCLFWLSIGVLCGCFWIILDPSTTGQIDTVASSLVVTIVTAWITATATSGH